MGQIPAVAEAGRRCPSGATPAILEEAAALLDARAEEIADRWVDRLEATIYAGRTDLVPQDLRDRAPELIHGAAEALRRGEPEAPQAPWTAAAAEHARLRLAQRVPLGDLVREFQMLRSEIRRALQEFMASRPVAEVIPLANAVESALDTLATISISTYGAELERARQRADVLARLGRRLASTLDLDEILQSLAEEAIASLCTAASVILVQEDDVLAARSIRTRRPELAPRLAGYYRELRLRPGQGIAGRVVASGQPVLIPQVERADLPAEVKADLQRVGIASYLVVPLRLEERVLGVLIGANAPGECVFTPGDLALATEMANTASLAISSAQSLVRERAARAEAEAGREAASRLAAELQTTLTAIVDAVITYDPAARIVAMNAAAERLLGYTAEEVRAVPFAQRAARLRVETAQGQPFPMPELPQLRALRGETVAGVTLVLHPSPERTVWASVGAAPIRTPGGEIVGVVASLTDVTRLYELQRQREDMLRAVSHDLRNPLAAIQGQAQLLVRRLERADVPARERQSADAIVANARRMNSMIQDLVDAARSEAGQLRLRREPVDLPSFVAGLLQRQAEALETGRVRIVAPAALPPVSADPDRLERILVNLLSNAVKFSAAGTEVTVGFERRDGEVVTSVTDRGPGIAPEDLPRLFERYFRSAAAREAGPGLGLGLYTTRLLVEAHGGRIWVETQPGQGSTFSFSLPVAPELTTSAAHGRVGSGGTR